MQVCFCIFFAIPRPEGLKTVVTQNFFKSSKFAALGNFDWIYGIFDDIKRKIQKIYIFAIDFFKKSIKLKSVTRKCYPDRKKFQSAQEKPHTPAEAVSFSPELASAPFFSSPKTSSLFKKAEFCAALLVATNGSKHTPLLCWFAYANQREEQDKSCVKHCFAMWSVCLRQTWSAHFVSKDMISL